MRNGLLRVEQARELILRAVRPLPAQRASLKDAFGCVLAEDIRAPIPLQPFDNSAVDGYAVRAADVALASRNNPVRLRVIEEIQAGRAPRKKIRVSEATRIFTGALIPRSADVVVMQEDTDSGDRSVCVFDAAIRGENIRHAGEDVRKGQVVLRRGHLLGAAQIGLLAALGMEKVWVIPRPRVGIVATGDEVQPAGKRLKLGEIYESNRDTLALLVGSSGGRPEMTLIARDTSKDLRAKIARLAGCEAIIIVGGVSVGKYDLVKPVLKELGGRLKFWKVAMKPGKPFVFGKLKGAPVFGLPGNPVSAFVTFLLLVRPPLLKMRGLSGVAPTTVQAIAAERFENRGDRRHFLRVMVEAGRVRLAGRQGSHVLSSLAAANALLDLPAGAAVAKGEPVSVIMI